MKRSHVIAGLALLFALLGVHSAQAQSPDFKYFNETKHNVQGEFWAYYQSVPGAEFLFGYPLTEEFESKDGMHVQYFQRARFEFHPELPAGQRIRLTPLGELLHQEGGVQLNINNQMACREYPQTGFPVCFAFLEFFDKYGGLAVFGYPISPFEYQDNMIVQYFQNTRLEWHPWKPEGQRVVVGDLGRAYFDVLGEDPAWLEPAQPLNGDFQIISLSIRAFPWKTVATANDTQILFVIVQDQTLSPVKGATGVAKIHWPDGTEDLLPISTNENGVAALSFPVINQPYGGMVNIEVLITYKNLTGETTTSFRIWY